MKNRCLLLILCICVFVSCQNTGKSKIMNRYAELLKSEILFPDSMIFVKDIFDTVQVDYNNKIKIVTYNDSAGCLNCNLALSKWIDLIKYVDSLTNEKVAFINIVNIRHLTTLKDVVYGNRFHYPLFIDSEDKFNNLNKLPNDYQFRTFLLDENNRVVLIGNPVQNQKIRDLYIRTICERLGVKTDLNVVSKPLNQNKSLGTFNWKAEQTATFTIHNTSNEPMLIDTLYSSCECTTAEIDKYSIEPADSAIVTVTFKAEKPEMFMREVYIDVQGKEQIVLSIEGEAVE